MGQATLAENRESGASPERSRHCKRGVNPQIGHCPTVAAECQASGKEDGKARVSADP